jgi:hypothetical protein
VAVNKTKGDNMLNFNDGVSIDTSGKLRPLHLTDGWYVVGNGMLVPVKDLVEAKALIAKMTKK